MALFFFCIYHEGMLSHFHFFFSWTVTNIVRYAFLSWPMTFLLVFFNLVSFMHGNEQETSSV